MKTKISRNGSAITTTEYEVRDIDEYGDAQDVNHFDNRKDAMTAAAKLMAQGARAVVIEQHTRRSPAHMFAEPDSYKTIAVMGDKASLALWGHE